MSDESFQAALGTQFGDAGLRQTAALIHALEPQDRLWALSQLPPLTRAPVEVLLDELEAIQMPRQRVLVDEVLSQRPRTGAAPGSHEEAVAQWVGRHGPSALAERLTLEPPQLSARLLALRPWPWRGEVLRALPESIRREVVGDLQRVEEEGHGTATDEERLLRLWSAQLSAPLSSHDQGRPERGPNASQRAAGAKQPALRWLARLSARWRTT